MRQRQWIKVLTKYDSIINYTKEKDNQVAHALSQKALVLVISMPYDPLGSKVKKGLTQDEYFGKIINLLGQENLTDKE